MKTVTSYLQDKDATFMVAPHAPTFSGLSEAQALGVAPTEVVKTVMLTTTTGHVAALVPASARVNTRKLEELLDVDDARLATEEEMTEDFPDFELGCLPPVSSLLGVPIVVDPRVTRNDRVAFAASPDLSVEVETSDLFKGEHLWIAPIGYQPELEEHFAE